MRELQTRIDEGDYDLGVLWTAVPDFYRPLGWEAVRPSGALLDDLRGRAELLREALAVGEATSSQRASSSPSSS